MWEINKQFHETESGRFLEFLAVKVVEIALVKVIRVSGNL